MIVRFRSFFCSIIQHISKKIKSEKEKWKNKKWFLLIKVSYFHQVYSLDETCVRKDTGKKRSAETIGFRTLF